MRYADDFVVLCARPRPRSRRHTTWCKHHLTALGLTLSAEKTKMTQFREGFAFLGFAISSWTVTMRPKSVEKFKTKIRELTPRHHNLDHEVVTQLNAVVRGTANYFATTFSAVGDLFRGLDRWLRMRIRCMKFKRKSRADNWRLRLKHLRSLGFCSCPTLRPPPAVATALTPRRGALAMGSPGARKGHAGK